MEMEKEYKGTTINNMLHENVLGSADNGVMGLLTRTYKCMVYFVAVFDDFLGVCDDS
jgi:hypothetical protein